MSVSGFDEVRASAQEVPVEPVPAGDPIRKRQVASALAEWRASLINVDGNNRLLYYKDLKVGTLDLADAREASIEQLRRGQPVRLGRLFADLERLPASQKTVRQIAGKARTAEEEYGVPICFLAVGMATWDDGRSASGSLPGRFQRPAEGEPEPPRKGPVPAAPVLLQSVELEARPGTPDGYELSAVGDAFVNPVLVHVLSSQFGVDVDESEILEAAGDDRMVFDLLQKACHDVPGFDIAHRMVIGTFSYMKQPMVDDLSEDQLEFLLSNDIVAAIAGVPEAVEAVRSTGGEVSIEAPDYEPPSTEFLVLDADASQSYVINAASAGRNLVVQGPPGTGKSQTIANLIADLIANDKSVLFVAQKRAAITAVLGRLERVGLDGLVLDMFAGSGSRKTIVRMLGAALEQKASARSVDVATLHQRWTTARDKLTAHSKALHEVRMPWGVSLWTLIGIERGLPGTAHSRLRLSANVLNSWTETSMEQMAGVAAEVAASGGNDPEVVGRSGWAVDAFSSLDDLNTAHQEAQFGHGVVLPRFHEVLAPMLASSGLAYPVSLADANVAVSLVGDTIQGLANGLGPALSPDLDLALLQKLIDSTDSKESRQARLVTLTWSERRAGKKAARGLFPDGPDLATAHRRLVGAKDLRARWEARGVRFSVAPQPLEFAAAEDALTRLNASVDYLQPQVQGYVLRDLAFGDLEEAYRSLTDDPHRHRLPQIHLLREQLRSMGLADVAEEMRAEGLDVDDSRARVMYVAAMSMTDQILSTDSRLAGITRGQLELWAADFLAADEEHMLANSLRVRRIAAERMARVLNEQPEQHAEIKKQVSRKRGFSSVRKLFTDAPEVLRAVKPCWAMSPLMVSQMLPAARLFDVVIFDEASQVMPADAIPALARGSQVVVAGDQHQLPPTDFFSKLTVPSAGDGDSEEDDAEDDVEITATVPQTRDLESILDTLDIVLAGQSRTLTWHYRSKDEKLIATSNEYVYHRQLVTFPGADSEDRIRFEQVESSKGLGKYNKSPSAEVNRVVELAIEHAQTRPYESLGIIAFGSDHGRRIESALEDRLESEPGLREFFREGGLEPFFVKNIERVQGDEREAIIVTAGYGKSDDGKMRYMWGPLLETGGERRLNVAITRARSRLTLVTSFGPDDIDPTANNSAGFQLMYRFLQFMSSGGTTFGDDPGRGVEMNPFEVDVFNRLTAAGLSLEPQWGVGGYRLDFAVRHPEKPGRFILAIECDGAMYHSGIVARERDRLRQRQLERLGWTFHRIWSTDWWTDPGPQIEEVLASYAAALAEDAADELAIPAANVGHQDGAVVATDEHRSAVLERTGPRPYIRRGDPITSYSQAQLVKLIRWIKSDDIVRTDEELVQEAMIALGLKRRGARIVQALTSAIDVAK